jgi:hypothetical protein
MDVMETGCEDRGRGARNWLSILPNAGFRISDAEFSVSASIVLFGQNLFKKHDEIIPVALKHSS